jgi:4'-phosphopantetheinyl transferase
MTRISPEPMPSPFHKVLLPTEKLSADLIENGSVATAITLLSLSQLQLALEQKHAEAVLISDLLSPLETQFLQRFTYPKRRLEWLGGRLAAKVCLNSLFAQTGMAPPPSRECSILPRSSGQPWLESLQPDRLPALSLSISHRSGYAAAMVHHGQTCGIDIQKQAAQLFTVQERFTSETELSLMTGVKDPLAQLAIVWVIKEAVKKCALPDSDLYFGSIQLVTFRGQRTKASAIAQYQQGNTAPVFISVNIAQMNDYMIACTTGEHYA